MGHRVRVVTVAAVLSVAVAIPAHGTVSGGDGLIAFHAADPGPDVAIYAVSADGDALSRLTTTTTVIRDECGSGDGSTATLQYRNPDRSPDGSMIVATAAFEGDGCYFNRNALLLFPGASGTTIPVTAYHRFGTGTWAASPGWSPDATRIAFIEEGRLRTIRSDSTGRSPVLASGAFPTWSPDGSQIALSCGSCENPGISVIPASGGEPDVIVDGGALGWLDWSPDGSRIVYTDGVDIFTVSPKGGRSRNLTSDLEVPATHPAYSPSGAEIAFVSRRGLWTMKSDGGAPGQIASAASLLGDPSWQPVCTVVGTSGDDVLVGTTGPDFICGLGGDDTIDGLGGADRLLGGSGRDIVTGGAGSDILAGGPGGDVLRGAAGDDLLNAVDRTQGNDASAGGTGYDVCVGDETDTEKGCP